MLRPLRRSSLTGVQSSVRSLCESACAVLSSGEAGSLAAQAPHAPPAATTRRRNASSSLPFGCESPKFRPGKPGIPSNARATALPPRHTAVTSQERAASSWVRSRDDDYDTGPNYDSESDVDVDIGAATDGPAVAYRRGLEEGIYRPDARQVETVRKLQELHNELSRALRPKPKHSGLTAVDSLEGEMPEDMSTGGSWWRNLIGGAEASPDEQPRLGPRGLYMYGGVGCGKTMLMDLFIANAPAHWGVRRAHFHDFMLSIHAALAKLEGPHKDPLCAVADGIVARGTRVLCLDELMVTDVADASILHRLFKKLWNRGLVLVCTSNRVPEKLYEKGLQRELFLPFIAGVNDRCVVHDMASAVDYRKLASPTTGLYVTGPQRNEAVEKRFLEMCHGKEAPAPRSIEVMMGRKLDIPRSGLDYPAALFTFQELCGKAVGASDYIALAGAFHTICVTGVPCFSAATRAQAYRFVTLVDVLYEHKTRLVLSADGPPLELFNNVVTHQDMEARLKSDPTAQAVVDDLVVDDNLGFVRDRTVSRLTEMGSLEFLRAHADLHAPELLLAIQEATRAAKRAARTVGAGAP
ncbi:unnamed protein product [Pedinophyceae sp. YPF-701]|nr:unnamed protein product [Pedinophyceae sp. YPF-701]